MRVPALESMPELCAELAPCYAAFCSLSGSRSWNHSGPNPISWESIRSWLDLHEIEGDLARFYARMIRAADRGWLPAVRRKIAQSSKGGRNASPRDGGRN